MFRRLFGATLLAIGLLAVSCIIAPAFAAGETSVTIPWGDWFSQAAGMIMPVAVAAVAFVFRRLPASMVAMLRTMQAEQLLDKAVAYGLNATAGAAKGKTVTVDVGNAVVAQAAGYAVRNGPGWLLAWLGGASGIAEKVIARLDIEPGAAANSGTLMPTKTS